MNDDLIDRARRILDGRTVESHTEYEFREWAEALLSERAAREEAERVRDAVVDGWYDFYLEVHWPLREQAATSTGAES